MSRTIVVAENSTPTRSNVWVVATSMSAAPVAPAVAHGIPGGSVSKETCLFHVTEPSKCGPGSPGGSSKVSIQFLPGCSRDRFTFVQVRSLARRLAKYVVKVALLMVAPGGMLDTSNRC